MGLFNSLLRAQAIKMVAEANAKKRATKASDGIVSKETVAAGIIKQAKEDANGRLKIVYDCAELVNTTKNPEVFFPRYNLMLEHLEALAGLECTGIFSNSKELPSETFIRVEAQFPAATKDFIDRSFADAQEKANSLKTEKGKTNAMQRYFANMEKYIIYMDGDSLAYFDSIKENNIT